MPEYDFSDEKVKVTITGKVINEEFAKIDFSKISPLDIERKINENKQLQVLS